MTVIVFSRNVIFINDHTVRCAGQSAVHVVVDHVPVPSVHGFEKEISELETAELSRPAATTEP